MRANPTDMFQHLAESLPRRVGTVREDWLPINANSFGIQCLTRYSSILSFNMVYLKASSSFLPSWSSCNFSSMLTYHGWYGISRLSQLKLLYFKNVNYDCTQFRLFKFFSHRMKKLLHSLFRTTFLSRFISVFLIFNSNLSNWVCLSPLTIVHKEREIWFSPECFDMSV